jgi:hypothetical protein
VTIYYWHHKIPWQWLSDSSVEPITGRPTQLRLTHHKRLLTKQVAPSLKEGRGGVSSKDNRSASPSIIIRQSPKECHSASAQRHTHTLHPRRHRQSLRRPRPSARSTLGKPPSSHRTTLYTPRRPRHQHARATRACTVPLVGLVRTALPAAAVDGGVTPKVTQASQRP